MSSFDPRSPGYYDTTTYSSISHDSDSDTPRASTDSSASPGLLRRVAFSPPPRSETSFEGHGHDDSFGEHAEVEAVLTDFDLDAEINATQDTVSQWSSSRPSYTSFSTSTPYSGTGSYTGTSASHSADTATATGTYFTRDPRVLSTISERTEHPSRPTSFAQNRLSAHRLSTISNPHARSAIESPVNANRLSTHSQGHARGATDLPTTSRRTGDLIAFFEDRAGTPSKEKERNTSPFLPTTQSTPHLGSTTGYTSTGYGYTTGFTSTGYGYTTGTGTGGYTTTGYTTSRPSSVTKSRSDDSRSTVSTSSGGGGTDLSLSSLLSPPVRGFGTPTGTYSGSGAATGRTQLSPSDFASTFSSAFGVARDRQDDTTPTRQTQTALRRSTAPLNEVNTSPRSPLTSVRNIVAAWKERTPGLGKVKSESSEGGSELSPPGASKMEGLFSLRRRASRQGPRGQPPVTPDRNGGKGNVGGTSRNRENEGITSSGNNVIRRRVSSTSSLIPPPFDMTDMGARENREPIRIGTLWYLNVHSPTPYLWQKCSALLYPHVLILSWSAPGGGRGVVSLDLINCTEVRSTPGFTHPGARGDVGGDECSSADGVSLVEILCPFQLLYSDGVERLAAESARERVRWVSAIWEALDRSLSLPNRSQSGSPTGSIGTIHSVASTTSTSAGSRSTVFVPPLHTIPSLSDLGSDSGGLSLSASRVPSRWAFANTVLVERQPVENAILLFVQRIHEWQLRSRWRRRYGAYSTSEEPSDREYSATTRSTLSGWTRSRTPTTTTEGFLAVEERESSGSEGYTTAHASPSPSTASFKSLPTIPSESDYQTLDTCKTCVSSEFVTAERCASDVETDYVTAEKCKTETETDFWTAEVCKSDKEETQYETASVCLTIPSEEGLSTPRSGLAVELPADEPIDEPTEAPIEAPIDVTIDIPIDVPIGEPIGVLVEVPTDEPIDVLIDVPIDMPIDMPIEAPVEAPIDMPVEAPIDVTIEAPIDEPIDLHEEDEVDVDLPPTPPPKAPSEVPSIISEEPVPEVSITPEAVTAQEEIAEDSLLESAPPTTQAPETPTPIVSFHTDSTFSYTESDLSPAHPELDTSVSSLTESSEPFVIASPRTVQTPVLSISDHDEEAVTPSVHPSQWPSETDVSFDSSALQPTPSIQSAALQEGIDGSFETSFMRPSISPLSSIARLTPITETISSLTPSPRQMFHPLELVSSPSSGPTPLTMSTSASSSLSRTASTVSGVSSIAIEAEEEDAVSVRAASDISTVPTLLSTISQESVRYMPMPSPRTVPLPVSPVPTSVSMSVSVTTPHDDIPSIHSVLETEHTRTHTEQTITHDIDRLLHHIQEIDQFRGQETQEIAENYVRTTLVVERSPPVPTRDTSVGASSVLSTPRGPRPRPGITLVEISPSSVMSFLSSHHSDDDLSLLETELEAETVERSYSVSREPSWPSSSSPSSSSVTPSETSSSEPSPGPSLSATSSSSPTPPPSSPTPSTASTTTVRQRDSITIETLRDMLISLREQTTALWEGQVSTNHMLDELRETRSGPLDTTEFNDRFRAIEVLLRQLIDRRVETERPVHIQPPSESISDVGTDVDAEDFQQRWQDWTRLLRDRVPLAAPQPRRARGNLDDELLALLQAPPPQVPIGVQPPPALIPFAYQPAVRPPRSRSTSPILRPGTFPIATEPVLFSPEIQHPPIHRRTRPRPDGRRLRDRPATEPETVFPGAPRPPTQQPVPPPGDFSDPRPPPRRTNIPPPMPIDLHGRPPSAPANLEPSDDIREPQTWYRPPRSQGLGMPPPPVIPGQQGGRQYVPMPPGPEHRLAQLATVDQQRELMRYMRGLNEWLERDVQDRQAELRGLRNDLARLGLGMQPGVQPPGVQPPGVQPLGVHPGHGVMPVGPVPPPFVFPGPLGFVPAGVPEPPVIPTYDGSPQPGQYTPFIPDEPPRRWPQGMPEPQHYPPGAQGPVLPGGYDGYPQPPHGERYERPPGDEDERFFPTSPHSGSSDAVLPTRPLPAHTIVVQQSDAEGSETSTDTQQTYAHPNVHHVQHPPEDHMAPGYQQDIPDVVHSGEHTHSHGSPRPQDININVRPQPTPPPQPEPPYGFAGIPPPPVFGGPDPGPMFAGPGSGPVIIHPPFEPAPRPRSRSRSSSGRGGPVVIQQSPPSGPVVARSPTRQEFGVPSGGGPGGPVVMLPGSVGHVDRSRSRSRSPRRHPYSPDYDYPRHWDDRRRRYYSPEYGPHRRLRDYYSRSPSPRRGDERHPDSPSPARSEERDSSRRDDRSTTHRAPTQADAPGRSHHTPSRRHSSVEGDPGRRGPSYDEGGHLPTHRSPTHRGHHTPSHGIPPSPRFEDAPRSPTVIRIEQPERTHPESHTGRSVIMAPHFSPGRPLSPASDLRHQLRHSPDVYIPTVHPSHSIPHVRDDDVRSRSHAGGMPAAIEQDDGNRQESEMVHIPPPSHGQPPDHDPHVHFDPTTTGFDEALNRRHERLDEVERELNQVVQGAHEAEDRREAEFRDSEEHREQIFLQNEQRRDDETRQRGDELFAELEERARSVPPSTGDNASIIESIHAASHEAASRHADDILETVRLEREQSARERESFISEREQERAEFAAERARMDEERDRRVHDLEEELARVRGELDSERQLRQTENEERAAANERDEGMHAQLSDITQLVSEQRDE
ncbi:uncharacterized protein BJ212DRAFT_1345067, partial [Suillus subaureus]